MNKSHPNLVLLSQLDVHKLDASADLFAEGFIWHYFNPKLPDIEGDYVGVTGLKKFVQGLHGQTAGTFEVEPVNAIPIGDELIVVHVRNSMQYNGEFISIDAAVIWRIVDGQFAEAWDVPSAFTQAV